LAQRACALEPALEGLCDSGKGPGAQLGHRSAQDEVAALCGERGEGVEQGRPNERLAER
jgi:hypothetical protein